MSIIDGTESSSHKFSIVDYLNTRFPALNSMSNVASEERELQSHEQNLRTEITLQQNLKKEAMQQTLAEMNSVIDSWSLSQDVESSMTTSLDKNSLSLLEKQFGSLNVYRDLYKALTALQLVEEVRKNPSLESFRSLEPTVQELRLIAKEQNDHSFVFLLIDKVFKSLEMTRRPLAEEVEIKFRSLLAKIGWPRIHSDSLPGTSNQNQGPDSSTTLSGSQSTTPIVSSKVLDPLLDSVNELSTLFFDMLILDPVNAFKTTARHPLHALEVMAEPLLLRFNYHFSGNRQTNRSDKPEWMFSYIYETIDQHQEFLTALQPTLVRVFPEKTVLHEFIDCFILTLENKLINMFSNLDQTLTPHLVYEITQFDKELKEKYLYDPKNWRGVAGSVLDKHGNFEKWLQVELSASTARYHEITDAKNAWQIFWDYFSDEKSNSKPTYSSVNVRDLLEGLTEHYSSLIPVKYRLRFLTDVQLALIDQYYVRLEESTDAFDSMTSSIHRAVTVSAEEKKLVQGLSGLERLCRIYGSLDNICAGLQEWGEELFFLELWDDIRKLSKRSKEFESGLDRKAKEAMREVVATSEEEEEGTLFDTTYANYSRLKSRVMKLVTDHFKRELQRHSKDYLRSTNWSSDNFVVTPVSMALNTTIEKMQNLLSFAERFFSVNDYYRLTSVFSSELSQYLWNYVYNANIFTVQAVEQLANDETELWNSFGLPKNQSYIKLMEANDILRGNQNASVRQVLTEEDLHNLEKRRK